jgi:hypothetical protein
MPGCSRIKKIRTSLPAVEERLASFIRDADQIGTALALAIEVGQRELRAVEDAIAAKLREQETVTEQASKTIRAAQQRARDAEAHAKQVEEQANEMAQRLAQMKAAYESLRQAALDVVKGGLPPVEAAEPV